MEDCTQPQSFVASDLASDLLLGPPPSHCTSEAIDFAKLGLHQYANSFGLMIHDLLTPGECKALLEVAEASSNGVWEQAMVNVGNGRQMTMTDVRNCGRIILDDFTLAERLHDRILQYLPKDIVVLKSNAHITGNGPVKRQETWVLSRLNERLRILKYTSGMYFRPHCDGVYVTPDGTEYSFLTVHLYLNGGQSNAANSSKNAPATNTKISVSADGIEEPLIGGATRFFSHNMKDFADVIPKTGACIVFQHRNLVHSGEDVVQGTKYTVRTDVMYKKVTAQDD